MRKPASETARSRCSRKAFCNCHAQAAAARLRQVNNCCVFLSYDMTLRYRFDMSRRPSDNLPIEPDALSRGAYSAAEGLRLLNFQPGRQRPHGLKVASGL